MEEKVARLLDWAAGTARGPVTVELNVTNLCNLRCLSCWQRSVQSFDSRRELSGQRLLQIVDEAAALDVREIRIPGSGEPFTRGPLVMELMRRIKELRLRGLIITNGTLLRDVWLDELVEMGWDNLTISIDAPRRSIHDRMRGTSGAFRKARRAIRRLNRSKQRQRTELPLLRFNTVLTTLNYRELPALMRFAAEHDCHAVSVQPMTVFSDAGEAIRIDEEGRRRMQPFIAAAMEEAERLNIWTNVGEFRDGELVEKSNRMDEVIRERMEDSDHASDANPFLSAPCYEPFYNLIILPEGETGPCSVFGGRGGDDATLRSLEEIWYGPVFTAVRKRLLKKILAEFCARCCVPVFMENQRLRSALAKAWAARVS
ncbi:radical SAM protein [bacterium]|nr:radical SAM protein [candidate division CSSED10-310 bacterium]